MSERDRTHYGGDGCEPPHDVAPPPDHHDDDDCPPIRVLTGDRDAIIGFLEDTAAHYAHHGQHARLSAGERERYAGRAEGVAEATEVLADWRHIEPRDLAAALESMIGETPPVDSEFVIIHRAVVPAFAAELYQRAEAHAADNPFPEDVDDVTAKLLVGDVPGWELVCPACRRVGGRHDDGCEAIAIPRQTGKFLAGEYADPLDLLSEALDGQPGPLTESAPAPDQDERATTGESVPPEDDK